MERLPQGRLYIVSEGSLLEVRLWSLEARWLVVTHETKLVLHRRDVVVAFLEDSHLIYAYLDVMCLLLFVLDRHVLRLELDLVRSRPIVHI